MVLYDLLRKSASCDILDADNNEGVMETVKYRRLGKTGLMVSEIGFGAEWMERHSADECKSVLDRAEHIRVDADQGLAVVYTQKGAPFRIEW